MYVDIIVNKTKIYTYAAPAQLNLQVGNKVMVPLRNKQKEGYVIAFVDQPEFNALPVSELVDDKIYFSTQLVELCKWMADHYKCFLPTAIKTMLP